MEQEIANDVQWVKMRMQVMGKKHNKEISTAHLMVHRTNKIVTVIVQGDIRGDVEINDRRNKITFIIRVLNIS